MRCSCSPRRATSRLLLEQSSKELVFAAGVGLFMGQTWARTVAVVVACLSIVVSFAWLPYYPLWSMLIIAMDVLVIWAVTAHGRDISRV